MSASKNLIQAAAGVGGGGDFYPYTIENSCRFDLSSYLYRTGTSTSSTWTLSFWIKRAAVSYSGYEYIFSSGNNGFAIAATAAGTNADGFYIYNGSIQYVTGKYRDTSAWQHWVVSCNAGTATIYVNNSTVSSSITAFSLSTGTNSTQVGKYAGGSNYLGAYLAQVALVDGSALTPSSFAEDKNGVWIPKNISGLTFGTDGFYLDFADSAALGTDVSGNGNNFTSSGLTSSDQMIDTPTNNFPTWNPLLKGISQTGVSTSDGNMVASHTGGAGTGYWPSFSTMTLPKNGKVYFEICLESVYNGALIMGIMSKEDAEKYASGTKSPTTGNLGYWDIHDGNAYAWGGDGQPDYATLGLVPSAGVAGGVVGFAIDLDAGKGWIRVNGTWILSGDPANGTNPIGSDIHTGNGASASGEYVIFSSGYISLNAYTRSVLNCGQDSTFSGRKTAGNYADGNGIGDFLYSVPSGFLALCTANLPEPVIGPNSATTSDENFYVGLYTGTGAELAITEVPFSPDKVDIKDRDIGHSWMVFDRVRGATNFLYYDTAAVEQTNAQSLKSFDANGFTLGTHSPVNTSGDDYVFYCYKGNGSGVSNTDGSITSTVSANQDAGISTVTYTSNSTPNSSIGHGLGVTPKVIITRRAGVGVGSQWGFFGPILGVDKYMYLDVDTAAATASGYMPAPSSTVVNTGANNWSSLNNETDTYVLYCFAEVEGFSSFGSYTGNGSTDGPFIYTGFRPAYLVIKSSSGTSQWYVHDSARTPYNLNTNTLFLDLANAESTAELESTYGKDMLSNGFKMRASHGTHNASGATYIYMAFAENPFKYSNAR